MNKPVAWVDEDVLLMAKPNDFKFTANADKPADDGITTWIPLYTHPVKELTDEEIIDLINKHIDYVPDEDNGMKVVGVMEFAKAILRKAQEK